MQSPRRGADRPLSFDGPTGLPVASTPREAAAKKTLYPVHPCKPHEDRAKSEAEEEARAPAGQAAAVGARADPASER